MVTRLRSGSLFHFVITKYQWQGTRCRMVCEYTGYWPMPSSGYLPCSLPSSINPSSARFLPPAVHVHASSRPFLAPSLHQPSLPLFLSPPLPLSLPLSLIRPSLPPSRPPSLPPSLPPFLQPSSCAVPPSPHRSLHRSLFPPSHLPLPQALLVSE